MRRTAFALAALLGACLPACLPACAGSLDGVSPKGNYALDAASCRGGDVFAKVTDRRIDLPTYSCTGVAYDQTRKTGDVATYQVKARSCVGEGGGQGKPDSFRIEQGGATLQFFWADGTKSGKLVACRK